MNELYDPIISEAAQLYRVPFEWIKAVIGTESGFDPNAVRQEPRINDASYGLMQILYTTARSLGYQGPPEGLLDPKTNIMLGAKYLGILIDRYGMDYKRVYSAYNSGSPDKYLVNSQVGRNVERAVRWLEKTTTGGSIALAVLSAVVLYFFLKR